MLGFLRVEINAIFFIDVILILCKYCDMTNIASRIIEKFGGASNVAEIVGTERNAVYKWTYPKERGGSDGLIPSKYHGLLLKAARDRKLKLKPKDFFDLTN